MATKRVVLGMLACMLALSMIAGPAVAGPRTARTGPDDRQARVAAAAQQGRERLPAGPGTFSAAPGQPGGHPTVTDILTGARDRRDLGSWLGAMADAITATSGADVAIAAPRGTEAIDEDPDAGEDDEPIPYSGSWATTYPAGDLDGDNLGDAVTYHLDLETWSTTLEAVRGDTGAVLWERNEQADGGLAWPLQEDLTGDGTADLLLFSLDIISDSHDGCWESDSEECWEQPWEATFRWTVGLVSGADGTTVWSRALDGWIKESFSEPSGSSDPVAVAVDEEFTYEFAGENVDVIPFFADLQAGGTPEVILNAIDWADRFTAHDSSVRTPAGSVGRWDGGYALESTTRVTVIDSAGTDVQQREEAGAGRISLLWPLTHPDGEVDVVWERSLVADTRHECYYAFTVVTVEECPVDEYGEDGFEIAVLDGETFEQRWSAAVSGYGTAWPAGGDLDADGRADIAIWNFDFQTWESQADLRSGSTGAALWDDDVLIRDVMATGRLNDAPGDDVIAIDYEETYDEETGAYTITVHFQRRDGATGALLGQTSHTAEDRPTEDGWETELLYATAGDDGSGDGALDLTIGKIVLVLHIHEDEEGLWITFEDAASSAVAESGATGEQLHAFNHDGYATLQMGPDFDGDGLTDAAQQVFTDAEEDHTASFAPVRLTGSGEPLWTDTATGDGAFHTWGDNAGGASVYRHVDTVAEPSRWSTLVTALDGRTGTALWSVASRP